LTYTWELDAAVTALWCSSLLLEVEVTELATWGLDNADLVGGGVVPVITRVSRVSVSSSSNLEGYSIAQQSRVWVELGYLTGSSVSVGSNRQYIDLEGKGIRIERTYVSLLDAIVTS